jgi:hypothetical protein
VEAARLRPMDVWMTRLLYRAAGALAALALTACLARTALLGWEDHEARLWTREGIEAAIRLAPGDTRNYSALATLDGPDRAWAFEQAVQICPFNSNAWIELGLDAEVRGDRARAERCLLRAARVDRTYAPCWSLANFYFRSNDGSKFWPWLRAAARLSYGDPQALAQLAWNLAGDAPEAIAALSEREAALESYVSLLFDNNRWGPAETAAGRLLALNGKDAVGAELLACDRFIDAGRPEPALRLWNRMAAERLVPGGPPEQDGGRGFDWRIPPVEGVETARFPGGGGLRFSFSGRQPEDCWLMLQDVLLASTRRWRLAFEYRTEDMAPETGVRWRIAGTEWQAPASETWTRASFDFDSPTTGGVAPLVLVYRRAPGTVRMDGSFWLRHVRIEPADR